MLPPDGTAALRALEQEARVLGIALLREEDGNLLEALYCTYMHFRGKFIDERGLMDGVPGEGEIWAEALADAALLRDHVNDHWIELILTHEQPEHP
jgi:hypothetical protein